jgi:hypothetical protein
MKLFKRSRKVYRFEVRPTGHIEWKYCVYDTLRDMEVPKSRHLYASSTQRDVDYYNELEETGMVFFWEEAMLNGI